MAAPVFSDAELVGDPLSAEDLEAIFAFADIPAKKWSRFPGAIVRRQFAPGELIVRVGDHGTTAFFISQGRVKIFLEQRAQDEGVSGKKTRESAGPLAKLAGLLTGRRPSKKSKKPKTNSASTRSHIPIDATVDLPVGDPVAELSEGDLFGEQVALATLKQGRIPRAKYYPRSASVVAATDVVVLEMLPHILNNILYKSPAFRDKLNEDYRSRALDNHLRSVPILQQADPDFILKLRESAEFRNVEPDQVICTEGEEADCFYLIRLGFVKVSRTLPGGEVVLNYLSRGDYFGESGLLPPALRLRATGKQPGEAADCFVGEKPLICGRAPVEKRSFRVDWDSKISREHIEISLEGRALRVRKLSQGRNPVVYNHSSAEEFVIQIGESFSIGETQFELVENLSTAGSYSETYSALDYVQLVRIEAADFQDLINRFPPISNHISEAARSRRETEAEALNSISDISIEEFLEQDLVQGQNLLLFDLDRCTRCDDCVQACVATHDDGVTRLIREGLRFENYLVPTSCRACEDPVCMTRCPVGSIRRKGSLDIVIENWCIGCTNCATDCPFGNINMVPVGGLVQIAGTAPEASQKAEPATIAATCDLCVEYDEPNCVRACPHDAAFRVNARDFFAEQRSTQMVAAWETQVKLGSADATTGISDLSAMMPKLRIVGGPRDGEMLGLKFPETTFGRAKHNDFAFESDAETSRNHCSIKLENGVFTLRDLVSSNGTFVNGQKVETANLKEGDIIKVGSMEMQLTARAPS